MNKKSLEQYRKQLENLSARVAATAEGLTDQVRSPTGGEAGGGMSNVPMHLGDVGSEVYSQELGTTLLENETYLHDEAVAALDRIDRGTFGTCENCARPIPGERLDAIPYARHCAPCASQLQSGLAVNMNHGRPDSWLGEPGHEGANQTGSPARVVAHDVGSRPSDVHAAGTPGGGSAVGGLAGTNIGGGEPDRANLEDAMGSGNFDAEPEVDDGEDMPEAMSGPAGGAVGGTPANKRASAGRPAPKNSRTGRTKKGANGGKAEGTKQPRKKTGK